MHSVSIFIIAKEIPGFAYMLQGYLQYYDPSLLQVRVLDNKHDAIHPIVLQVMKEDGIHLKYIHEKEISSGHMEKAGLLITINSPLPEATDAVMAEKYLTLRYENPFEHTKYDDIVETFRKVREEIKKQSIEIAGSFLQDPDPTLSRG